MMNLKAFDMTQEEKLILLRDLSARLLYGVICNIWFKDSGEWKNEDMKLSELFSDTSQIFFMSINGSAYSNDFKPYLRPMSSMTEEEVKEIAILHGVKNILSIKITDEYINITVDDGFSSIDTITIWYDEIVSSIESFDWLNKKMFDYRGLIEKGLALEAPEGMYNTKIE